MLTKTKKILLGVFLAMFAVPEALWSPVVNGVYGLLQNSNHVQDFRPNFLVDASDLTLLLFVLLIQLIGLVGSLVSIFQSKNNPWLKLVLIVVLALLALITSFVLLVAFSLRRGIGIY